MAIGNHPTRYDRTSRKASVTRGRGSLFEHFFAISGALLVIAVVVKALRVAHMDLTTAQMLLVNGNVASVISGVLLLFFPGFVSLGLVLCLAAFLQSWPLRRGRWGRLATSRLVWLAALFSVFLVLAALAVPARTLTIAAAAVGGLLAFELALLLGRTAFAWMRRRRGGVAEDGVKNRPKPAPKASAVAGLFGLVLALAIITALLAMPVAATIFNDVVWLPSERVQLYGQSSVVAYEISRSEGRVLLLLDETRQVVAVPEDQIRYQQPCRLSNLLNSEPSLWDLATHAPGPRTLVC
jgi:hypothetical protein